MRGRPSPRGVRVEVRSSGRPRAGATGSDRGRGLRIAREAAEGAGGSLEMKAEGDETVVAIELPRRGEGPSAA